MRGLFSGSLFVICVLGCAPTGPGTFKSDAFHHDLYDYRVEYGEADGRHILSQAWRVENFTDDRHPKDVPRYHTKIEVDYDNDGEEEELSEDAWAFDLVLEHESDAGTMWLSTRPVSDPRYAKDPVVLMREAVSRISGASFFGVEVMPGVHSLRSRRITATFRGPIRRLTIAGAEAVMAEFEVADIDRIQVRPEVREAVVRLVFIKTPLEFDIAPDPRFAEPLSVMMVAGYVNHPPDFDKHVDEFQQLLGRIVLSGKSGVEHAAPTAPSPLPVPEERTSGGEMEVEPESESSDGGETDGDAAAATAGGAELDASEAGSEPESEEGGPSVEGAD